MFSYNNIQLIGRVGNLEVRVAGENELIEFSVATSRFIKAKGEAVTTWHSCTLWKPSEFIKKNIKKGIVLFVEGEQTYSEWEKDGVKHIRGKINVQRVVFVGKTDKAGEPLDEAKPEVVEDLPF